VRRSRRPRNGTTGFLVCLVLLMSVGALPSVARADAWPCLPTTGPVLAPVLGGCRPTAERVALAADLSVEVVRARVCAIQFGGGGKADLVTVDNVRVLKGNGTAPAEISFWMKDVPRGTDIGPDRVRFEPGDEGFFFLGEDAGGYLFSGGSVLIVADSTDGQICRPSELSPEEVEAMVRDRARARSVETSLGSAACVVEGVVAEVEWEPALSATETQRMRVLLADLQWHRCTSDSSRVAVIHPDSGASWYDQPEFVMGERVLLALTPNQGGVYHLSAGWQSVLERLSDGSYIAGRRAPLPRQQPRWDWTAKVEGASPCLRRTYAREELLELIQPWQGRSTRSN
jgi:hypothetical protein